MTKLVSNEDRVKKSTESAAQTRGEAEEMPLGTGSPPHCDRPAGLRQRAAAMPGDLSRYVYEGGPLGPTLSDDDSLSRAKAAALLTELTDGSISVAYSNECFLGDRDEGSMGHLFLPAVDELDHSFFLVALDGRKGHLAKQLVKELTRVGRKYLKAANGIRAHIERHGVDRLLIEPTSSVQPIPLVAVAAPTIP